MRWPWRRSKRSPNAPELPTIAESGLAGFDAAAWQGLVGPAGMPPDVVKRLNDAFNQVMAMPAVREKLVGGGLEPVGGTPDQFARFIASRDREVDRRSRRTWGRGWTEPAARQRCAGGSKKNTPLNASSTFRPCSRSTRSATECGIDTSSRPSLRPVITVSWTASVLPTLWKPR